MGAEAISCLFWDSCPTRVEAEAAEAFNYSGVPVRLSWIYFCLANSFFICHLYAASGRAVESSLVRKQARFKRLRILFEGNATPCSLEIKRPIITVIFRKLA